jgi:hypothetical protein
MGRWLLPALLALSAAWLTWQNHGGATAGRVAVLPWVEVVFPETAGDPAAQAARSEQLAWGATGVVLVLTTIEQIVRSARRRRADDEDRG